jgi:hypothetical protein
MPKIWALAPRAGFAEGLSVAGPEDTRLGLRVLSRTEKREITKSVSMSSKKPRKYFFDTVMFATESYTPARV